VVRNYELGLFNQLEELNKKMDKLLKENKHQSLTISLQVKEINDLKKQLEEKDKKIDKLLEENEKHKNKNNKNSSNSSKPSSTDMFKPKKTGANLYNSRTKSGRKIGAQINHEGHALTKEKLEQQIKDNKVKVIEVIHEIFGDSKKEPIIKYKLGIETKTVVEKHIFKYSEESTKPCNKLQGLVKC